MYAQARPRANAISAYQNAANTISPAQAIVMLYDGAIQRVHLAQQSIAEGAIEKRYHAVMKAYAIIQGLQSHLDFEAGGEVAESLNRYYEYICLRLNMINIKNDPDICKEVIARLKEMRHSWQSIAEGSATGMTENRMASSREAISTIIS